MDFCKAYNDQTKDKMGSIVPVEISVTVIDHFFCFKTPPVSKMILQALGIKSGSPTPNTKSVGKLSKKQLLQIVNDKMNDLNAYTEEQACKIIEGSARSMGVKVEK